MRTLENISGNKLTLADYKGKWLLIDFWGTWCVPCRREMPEVNALAKQALAGHPPNTALLSVACHDTKERVQEYLADKGYQLRVAMSDSRVERDYEVQGYSSKVLVSPAGKMFPLQFGEDYATVLKTFQQLDKPADSTQVKTKVE